MMRYILFFAVGILFLSCGKTEEEKEQELREKCISTIINSYDYKKEFCDSDIQVLSIDSAFTFSEQAREKITELGGGQLKSAVKAFSYAMKKDSVLYKDSIDIELKKNEIAHEEVMRKLMESPDEFEGYNVTFICKDSITRKYLVKQSLAGDFFYKAVKQ